VCPRRRRGYDSTLLHEGSRKSIASFQQGTIAAFEGDQSFPTLGRQVSRSLIAQSEGHCLRSYASLVLTECGERTSRLFDPQARRARILGAGKIVEEHCASRSFLALSRGTRCRRRCLERLPLSLWHHRHGEREGDRWRVEMPDGRLPNGLRYQPGAWENF
jgi:hypothetical protein